MWVCLATAWRKPCSAPSRSMLDSSATQVRGGKSAARSAGDECSIGEFGEKPRLNGAGAYQ